MNGEQWRRDSIFNCHIFNNEKLEYDTVNTARCCRLPTFKMADAETGMEITIARNELATRLQRLPQHL